MLHYLGFLALLYIVALVIAPSQVLTLTVVVVTAAWNLLHGSGFHLP